MIKNLIKESVFFDRNKIKLFLFGGILGALVFLLIYGPSTLDVTYDSWIRCGYIENDIVQHYATWQYFRNDEWQLSLTWMNNAAGPEGVAAAWGDPVSWAALFFKFLSPMLPETFQYFGILALVNFILQGGFAWLLIDLFDSRWSVCAPGTLVFLVQPVFLERVFRHGSLSSQWLVLAMLYLYFIGRRRKYMPWFGWCLVFGIIPGVHAYFLAMAFGLLCASALETVIQKRRYIRPIGLVVVCMGITLVCARVLGLIMPGASTGDGGFGRYSMNLNALFNPMSADFLSEAGVTDWSLLLPNLPQMEVQYDGFNYLGLGILAFLVLLAVWAAVYAVKNGAAKGVKFLGAEILSHMGLVIACVAFALFAVSNVAYFGDSLVYSVGLPEKLGNIFSSFRASGRMFWPVSYLLSLGAVLFIARKAEKLFKTPNAAALALALLLLVQLGDMSGLLIQKHRYFSEELIADNQYQSPKAQQLIAATDEIRCLEGPIFDFRLAECLIHWNPKIQTNIVFFGKGNFVDTYSYYPLDKALLLSGQSVPEDTLYVTSDKALCLEILGKGHTDLAAWQLEDFYLIGTADQRPAPDFE